VTGRRGLLAGLFLAGLALRPQIVGVGPLIPAIQDDLDIPHAVAGLLFLAYPYFTSSVLSMVGVGAAIGLALFYAVQQGW